MLRSEALFPQFLAPSTRPCTLSMTPRILRVHQADGTGLMAMIQHSTRSAQNDFACNTAPNLYVCRKQDPGFGFHDLPAFNMDGYIPCTY
jgi:hypothetical protein